MGRSEDDYRRLKPDQDHRAMRELEVRDRRGHEEDPDASPDASGWEQAAAWPERWQAEMSALL